MLSITFYFRLETVSLAEPEAYPLRQTSCQLSSMALSIVAFTQAWLQVYETNLVFNTYSGHPNSSSYVWSANVLVTEPSSTQFIFKQFLQIKLSFHSIVFIYLNYKNRLRKCSNDIWKVFAHGTQLAYTASI